MEDVTIGSQLDIIVSNTQLDKRHKRQQAKKHRFVTRFFIINCKETTIDKKGEGDGEQ